MVNQGLFKSVNKTIHRIADLQNHEKREAFQYTWLHTSQPPL